MSAASDGRSGGVDHDAPVVPLLNVANLLTLSRLVIVPLVMIALFVDGGRSTTWRLVASALFAIASITDHLDGRLARKYQLVTDFGKIADPIADKVLTGLALIGLSVLGEVPWWVTAVIVVREIGITLMRFWVIRFGVISASPGGKAKTFTQIIAIVLFLLPLPAAWTQVSWTVMTVALVLTVATGADYVVRALRLRAHGRGTQGRRVVGG